MHDKLLAAFVHSFTFFSQHTIGIKIFYDPCLRLVILFGSWYRHWGEKLASFPATHPSWYHQWDTKSPSKNAIFCICIVSWYGASESLKFLIYFTWVKNILLYFMVQWTCIPPIYWIIFLVFSSALVLSIYPWVMNLYVRWASDLFQTLEHDPCILAAILVKCVLQQISDFLTDMFLIL